MTSTDGTATGTHYDPHVSPHGVPDSEIRHVGDLVSGFYYPHSLIFI